MNLAVIIVNYNGGDLLARCLDALGAQSRPADRVIVVDNASHDGSLNNLPVMPACQILRQSENSGFAAANNTALASLEDADLVITLNPDAFPAVDFIEQLERAADRFPQYASFACRMMQDDLTLDGAGDVYHISGFVWRDGHGRSYRQQDEMPREVFSPCAGAAMYRAEALRDLGGFDESFFCYVEDIDLGYRLRLRGERCLYLPQARVDHLGSAISDKYPGFALYHGHRNLLWALLKNTPPGLLLFMLPLHLFATLVAGLICLSRGQFRTFLRAKVDALRGLPRVLEERGKIQAGRSIGAMELLRSLDYSLLPGRRLL